MSRSRRPRRVELPFQADIGPQVRPASIPFTDAFADGCVDREIVVKLVFETDLRREAIGFAGRFATHEIDFRKQLGSFRDPILLGQRQQPHILRAGYHDAEFRVGNESVTDISNRREQPHVFCVRRRRS